MPDLRYCPRCSTERVPGARYCEACRFDFESATQPLVPGERSYVEQFAAAVYGRSAESTPTPKSHSRLSASRAIFIGLVAAVLVLGAYAFSRAGNGGSASPAGASANIPPVGQIWFGASFSASTFEIGGQTSSVGVAQPFAFVAHTTESINASDLFIRVWWNGSLVANNRANATGSGAVWGSTHGPLNQAGSWLYELTDTTEHVLASGTVTAK